MCAPMWFYATSMQKALSHWEWMLGNELWSLEKWEYFYSLSHLFTAIFDSFFLAKNYFLQVTVWLLILQTTGSEVGCVSRGLWTGMVTHIIFQDYFYLFHESSKNSWTKSIWRRTAQSISFPPNVSGREMSQLHVRAALQHISVKFSNLDWKWASGTIVNIFLTYSSQNLASHSNESFLEFLRMQADIISFNLIPNFDTNN